MKTLTKIKLINWQTFYDSTIEVRGNVLVTGENGAGKSTLLDALYFILAGGSTRFNLAANEATTRTVETYMRGTIGAEGREYLRPGASVISHIALQFQDDDGSDFVIGCAFEIRDGAQKSAQSFYHLKGALIDPLFYEEEGGKKRVLNAKGMFEKATQAYGERALTPIKGTKAEIRNRVARLLDINGSKYYELLPKAIAFKPIQEVNDFVYNFLLPENDIDIGPIRENVQSYLRIRENVERDEAKKAALDSIYINYHDYEDRVLERSLLQAFQLKSVIDKAEDEIASLKVKIKSNESAIEEEGVLRKQAVDDLDSLNHRLYALASNDWFQAIEENRRRLEEIKGTIKTQQARVSAFNLKILNECQLGRDLGLKVNFDRHIRSEDFASFQEDLRAYHQAFEQRVSEFSTQIGVSYSKLMKAKENRDTLQNRFESLRMGLPVYEPSVNSLISLIHTAAIRELGHDIDVVPFCELIEVNEADEEWRNALEGYLNTRRFDLFVKPEYYDFALSVYERCKMEHHIYGVGLVNVNSLPSYGSKPGSLATKVHTASPDAQLYVDYLLGDIICVDNEQELKKFPSSITRTVMVYRNHAARQTAERAYRTPYIGKSAFASQSRGVREALQAANEEVQNLEGETGRLRALLNRAANSKREDLLASPNEWRAYAEALEAERRLEAEQKDLAGQHEGEATEDEAKLRQWKSELEAKRDSAIERITRLGAENEGHARQIERLNETIETQSASLKELTADPKIAAKLDSFAKNCKLSSAEIVRKIGLLTTEINSLERALITAMASYVLEFHFDSVANIANIGDFLNEYNQVVKRELAQYRADLERAEAQCVSAFQENYIARIRKNIFDQKANIRKLNAILADKPFGNDGEVYQFVVERSKDPTFGAYYDIFCSKEEISSRDLFLDRLDDKDRQLMRDLFDRLSASAGDEKAMKLLRQYTDYRMFMSYDIEITNRNGERSYFSKISRGKSGGETQTPFYVIIAASFDQIVHENALGTTGGCIVILDEAFNKMDASRIAATMTYFNELSIQLIIGLPSNNAKILMPYVDTTVGLVKNKDRTFVRTDVSLRR